MGKPAATKKKPTTDHRRDRTKRAAAKGRGANARAPDSAPIDTIDAKAIRWKASYIEQEVAKIETEAARLEVKDAILATGERFAVTSLGTIVVQARAGQRNTDWEGLARKALAIDWEGLARKLLAGDVIEANLAEFTQTETPKAIATLLPSFTSVSAGGDVLSALPGWGAEAKAVAAKRAAEKAA